jgi:DNA-binding NtrC family response regulator
VTDRAHPRVLVIEDSRVTALLTQRLMEAEGLQVTLVQDQDECQELLDDRDDPRWHADLGVFDVMLGGPITGLDMMRMAEREHPDMIRVVFSAVGDSPMFTRELAELAQLVIVKGRADIAHIVRGLLDDA